MNWNRGHSPPFQGGEAARLQEMAPFLDWRSRGGSYPTQTTRPLLGVAASPPWKGGECPRFQFRSQPYSLPIERADGFGCLITSGGNVVTHVRAPGEFLLTNRVSPVNHHRMPEKGLAFRRHKQFSRVPLADILNMAVIDVHQPRVTVSKVCFRVIAKLGK